MNNIQKLAKAGEKSHRIFAATVTNLMTSQGFYGRLCNAVNEMNEESYNEFYEQLSRQNFKEPLDVIYWLEC